VITGLSGSRVRSAEQPVTGLPATGKGWAKPDLDWLPASCTAVGKALLAFSGAAAEDAVLTRPLPRRPARSVSRGDALRGQFAAIGGHRHGLRPAGASGCRRDRVFARYPASRVPDGQ
jgi:hypothetical protein